MTPGNKDTSDNAAEPSIDDAQDNVVSIERDDSSDTAEPAQSATSQNAHAEEPQDDASVVDEDASVEGDLNDAINAEGASETDDDDPLGFGEQRMGEEAEPLDEMGQLRVQLEESEARASENWDRLLRLQAEMENQRKRAQNDVTKARKFALESIVGDLLPVKDSLEMGLMAAQAEDVDPASIIEGAELTLKMLAQVFDKNNIAEVNPVDEKFDPEFHQAMSMQEIEGKVPNTVASVMQKGYTLNERLVRPALVMVAK